MPSNKILTIATSSVAMKLDALDLKAIDPLLDSYNIMSYDFSSGSFGDTTTGHQSNPIMND
jgi:GH18 family chitinase